MSKLSSVSEVTLIKDLIHDQWRSYIFWCPGQVTAMPPPLVEIMKLKKSLIQFPFIWANRLKFVEFVNRFFYLKYSFRCPFSRPLYSTRVGIAQSVQTLVTDWAVLESNPGGRHFPHSSRPALGPTQPLVQWAQWISFPGANGPGWGSDYPHAHLASRLKKEYSYTSTLPPSLNGQSSANFT